MDSTVLIVVASASLALLPLGPEATEPWRKDERWRGWLAIALMLAVAAILFLVTVVWDL